MKTLVFAIHGKKEHGKDTLGGFILEAARARGCPTERFNFGDPLKDEFSYGLAIYESYIVGKGKGFGWFTEHMERVEADFEANSDTWEPFIMWLSGLYDIKIPEAATVCKQMVAAAMGDYDDPSCENYNEYDKTIYSVIRPQFDDDKLKGIWRVGTQWWATEFRRRLTDPNYWTEQLRRKIAAVAPGTVVGICDVRFPNEFEDSRKVFKAFLVKIVRDGHPAGPSGSHISETALDHLPDEEWNAVVHNNQDLNALQRGGDAIYLSAKMWHEGTAS